MAEAPQLSAVVATLGLADVERTVAGLLAAAGAGGISIEVIVVWQADSPPPSLGPARVLDVYPAGLSYARNRGLALASAPLVGFVDDDEVVDPGWAAGLVDGFSTNPDAAAVFGAVAALDEEGLPYCVVEGTELRVFRRPTTPPWVVGTGGNMAFRRDRLQEISGFTVELGAGAPGRSAEESDVIVRLLRAGHPLVWTPDAVVYHPSKTPAEHLASREPYAYGTGALARRHRDLGLAARYGVAIAQSWRTGVLSRDRQRRREAVRTAAGFTRGLASAGRPRSPEPRLGRMPAGMAAELAGMSLRPGPAVWASQPRFRYRAADLDLAVLPGAPDGTAGLVHRDARWILERR
ncbi:MAG TPA: glycosyltransferase [Mycobacteriales bacterium]|nr:glycosyltransferase [Mycobacteriales bacterium]